METDKQLTSDEPIRSSAGDVLGRQHLARAIATELRTAKPSTGIVFAILGPWGSGKTSLLNLIRDNLEGPPWIQAVSFNPWLFSGSGELVTRFFYEIAAQLRAGDGRFADIASQLSGYGEVIAPLQSLPGIGWIIGVARSVSELQKKRKGGVEEHRSKLEGQLARLDAPIVVFVDDIDRLEVSEIRDVFRLVRLTANFPNLIYILAFDRVRVEDALNEHTLSGRAYLEKIVQVAYDLPAVPRDLLKEQVDQAIFASLKDAEVQGKIDQARWGDTFSEVVFPLITTMRDVRRFAASIRATARSLDGRIELGDVLALETVRIFIPDLFHRLMTEPVRRALTSPSPRYYPRNQQQEQAYEDLIRDLVKHSHEHQDVCTCLINRVFPDASRHLERSFGTPEERPSYWKNKRLAHPALLDFYAERVMGTEQSALYIAERALEHIDAPEQLARFLQELDPAVREDTIKSLYNFIDDIPESSVVPVCRALLETLGVLSKRSRSMYELSPRRSMLTLVVRLIWKLDSEELRDDAIKSISADSSTLSARHSILQWTGYDEKSEDYLISKQVTEVLSRALRADLSAADHSSLDGEPELLWMLTWVNETENVGGTPIRVPSTSNVACALLRQSRNFERSRGMTTRFVEVKNRIDMRSLMTVGGSEHWIREALRHCSENEGDEEMMEIVPLIESELSADG